MKIVRITTMITVVIVAGVSPAFAATPTPMAHTMKHTVKHAAVMKHTTVMKHTSVMKHPHMMAHPKPSASK